MQDFTLAPVTVGVSVLLPAKLQCHAPTTRTRLGRRDRRRGLVFG